MSPSKPTIQKIGTIGLMVQTAGFFMPGRTVGLTLIFVGLGVSFFALKMLYETSESRTVINELFPKNTKPRTS